jgi:GTP-binding protein
VLNKCDLIADKGEQQRLVEAFTAMGYKAFAVSAAALDGFDALLTETVKEMKELPPPTVFTEAAPTPEIPQAPFTVSRDGATFVVEGRAMQRIIDSVNFDDEESLNWFHRTLRDRELIDALREAGAGEGSTVRIGDMEFDFID